MESNLLMWVALLLGLGLIDVCHAHSSAQDFLDAHNSVRLSLGISPLVWDDDIASYIKSYANQRVSDCNFMLSGGPYGENLYWSSGSDASAADAVNYWVAERQYYDDNSNTCAAREDCRHYTQVVWRDSQRLGCARVNCNNGGTFIICNYDPRGNYRRRLPY